MAGIYSGSVETDEPDVSASLRQSATLHMTEEPTIPPEGDNRNDEAIDDIDEAAEVMPTAFSITSYGADFPVDGLVKRLDQGDIVIPSFALDQQGEISTTRFQREFVWKKPQADRFIESLLLGLPVPGIFLVNEPNGKLLVLDGQQRLRTLQGFYRGVLLGNEFALQDVQNSFRGKTYRTLEPDDRRRLDNSIIHATIVRQDEPSEDQNSIYLIFERLNSGGTILQPQEIRIALYHGPIVDVLSRLNRNTDWRTLYGRKSARLKDVELILRFFALYYGYVEYRRPMKEFLNRYMAANSELRVHSERELTALFERTVGVIRRAVGPGAFRPRKVLNAATLDSVMVGIAIRLEKGPITDDASLRAAYEGLLKQHAYQTVISGSTADEESVRTRIGMAKEAFNNVP
jgi:hypothetical protein